MAKAALTAAVSLAQAGIPVIHDISSGGLAFAVAEICVSSGVGATVHYSDWRHLFCEDPHRFLIAATAERAGVIERLAAEIGIPAAQIGQMGGAEIAFDRRGLRAAVDLEVATRSWRTGLSNRLG
jgi:phosphoribosylformylglycinamidine synthase